jgi:hypothetical protein
MFSAHSGFQGGPDFGEVPGSEDAEDHVGEGPFIVLGGGEGMPALERFVEGDFLDAVIEEGGEAAGKIAEAFAREMDIGPDTRGE